MLLFNYVIVTSKTRCSMKIENEWGQCFHMEGASQQIWRHDDVIWQWVKILFS